MKLLLIQPSDSFVNWGYESPPLGLAYLGSIAEQRGWEVKIIVASTLNIKLSDEQVLREAACFSPDVIGIGILTFSAKISYKLIKGLSYINSILIAGGPHATILPEEVLIYSPCNIVVRGEGEETFNELLNLIEKRERNFIAIRGASFKDEQGRIFHNPDRELLSEENLSKLPFPAKHLFPKKHFERYKLGNIIASRGCPFSCTFCSQNVFRKTYRIRKVENVFEEMEELYKRYDIRHFFFADSTFTVNEAWVNSLCEKIIKSKLSFTWICSTRVDCVTEGLLKEMEKAGCICIKYGIESISPYSLDKMKKGIKIEDIKRALILTSNAGIGIALNFMQGFPWETCEDIKRQVEFIQEVFSLTYFVNDGSGIVPFPGTEIYNEYNEEYKFGNWWLTDRFIGRELHLYQRLLLYDPAIEKPFFPLSQETIKEIKKAHAIINQKLILSAPMMKKARGRYIIIAHNTSLFRIVKLAKLFFIISSKLIAYLSPELELRFWVPTYKVAKTLWRNLKNILTNVTGL